MFGSTLSAQPNLLPSPLLYCSSSAVSPPLEGIGTKLHTPNPPYKTKQFNDWLQRRPGRRIDKFNLLNETVPQIISNGYHEMRTESFNNNFALDMQDSKEFKVSSETTKRFYCDLCNATLNGNLQANAHYEGKNHVKKLRQYLDQLGQAKGLKTLPANEKSNLKDKKMSKPLEDYCKLCNVAFTSDLQAKQHYDGRNHQRRLRGEPPLPKGFFNPLTGKWQRQPVMGISNVLSTQQKKAFSCELCNVNLTSQEQLEAHLSGSKHKYKLRNGQSINPQNIQTKDDCQ